MYSLKITRLYGRCWKTHCWGVSCQSQQSQIVRTWVAEVPRGATESFFAFQCKDVLAAMHAVNDVIIHIGDVICGYRGVVAFAMPTAVFLTQVVIPEFAGKKQPFQQRMHGIAAHVNVGCHGSPDRVVDALNNAMPNQEPATWQQR